MKKILIFLMAFAFTLAPIYTVLAVTSNAGFIPDNIWYSKYPIEEGDKIKIYTVVYNPDIRQLSGTVFFFDKTTFLGNKNFTIPGKNLQDISIDWTANAGDHTIFGQIQNAKFLNTTGEYENANLLEIKTSENKFTVPKTIIQTEEKKENSTNENTEISIPTFIKENTPEIVSSTIESTTNVIEDFRQDTSKNIDLKKTEVAKEVKELKDNKKISESKNSIKSLNSLVSENSPTTNAGIFLKPFKYTELFALSLFSTIFSNKYIFYGLAVILIFFIFRFIIRRFF